MTKNRITSSNSISDCRLTRRDVGKGIAAILASGVFPNLADGAMHGVRRGLALRSGIKAEASVPPDPLKFTANSAGSTIAMTSFGSAPSVSLLTSTDGVTWSDFTVGTTTITLDNAGDYVYFKAGSSGNTGMAESIFTYNYFVMTGSVAASGNIQSLLDANAVKKVVSEYCYCSMFHSCSSLTSAPALPATTLADSCYAGMFYGCTGLTSAPALPATTLAEYCYEYMFSGCTGLTSAPALPATTLAEYCYDYMFSGCSSLKISENGGVGTKILDIPSGTTVPTSWCTSMFSGTGGTFTGSPSVGVPYYCYS